MSITTRKESLPMLASSFRVKPQSIDEKARTLEVIATTGFKGLRRAPFGDFMEELSLKPGEVDIGFLNSGRAKFLSSHETDDLDAVLGKVLWAKLNPDSITAKIQFSDDEIAERNFKKIRDGFLSDVSIGYQVRKYMDVSTEDDEIPTYRAVDYEILEVSLVQRGFDPGAVVRNQEPKSKQQYQVEIIRPSTEVQRTTHMNKKPETVTPPEDILSQERARVKQLRSIGREYEVGPETIESWIDTGASTVEAEKAGIQHFKSMRASQQIETMKPDGRIHVGANQQDKLRDQFVDALACRIDETFKPKSDIRVFQGHDLLRSLEIYSGRKLGETSHNFAKRSMSSGDFPLLLANVAEKVAQNRYSLAPKTYQQWTKSKTLRNYKEARQLRAGDFPGLIERPENAEFQHGAFGEEQELVQLKDYGRIISFSSQSIVNDDLSQLKQVATEGGLSASRLENSLVYSALVTNKTMGDSIALYHASHNNLGTAGAIGETTVSEAWKMMRKQLSVDGLETLNVRPAYLICSPDKEVEAMKFLASINPAQTSNVNIFQNSMTLVVDSALTGNAFYFAADPSVIETVCIYRLEGAEQPQIESRIDWNTNSLQLKVAHAAAAAPMDWRGLFKNAGA